MEMTEKRFKHSEIIQDDGQTICYGIEDTQTKHIFNVIGDGIYDVSEKELIKLLNELNDENEQLKSENQELKQYLSWQDMELEEMEDLND